MRGTHLVLSVWALLITTFPSYGLSVRLTKPETGRVAEFMDNAICPVDEKQQILAVPQALAGGQLLVVAPSNADEVRFEIDLRSMVYVCWTAGVPVPDAIRSWTKTDMIVGVNDPTFAGYQVYARRFPAGEVVVPALKGPGAGFIVVKESVPIGELDKPYPRKVGWNFTTYDMDYCKDMIRHAPEYGINHLELSHRIVMNTTNVLYSLEENGRPESTPDPHRRSNIRELIDYAHAYGIPEVTIWVHEFCTREMPAELAKLCYGEEKDDPINRRKRRVLDANHEELWQWLAWRYDKLFSDTTIGCPQVDGVVLTFSEVAMFNDGYEIYDHPFFFYGPDNTATNVARFKKVMAVIQEQCRKHKKTFYVRTWAGGLPGEKSPHFDEIADAILEYGKETGDRGIWLHSKNVGTPSGHGSDWWNMDSPNPVLGKIANQGYNEMLEFDLGGEYFWHGLATYVMSRYFQTYLHYCEGRAAVREKWIAPERVFKPQGAVTRADRYGGYPFYTANRLNFYAFSELMADPDKDYRAIILEFCRKHFPPEAAEDIAYHYDDPDPDWDSDTRAATWRAAITAPPFGRNILDPGALGFPGPPSIERAKALAYAAIARIDRHRAQLQTQTTLDTRTYKNDYQVLHEGLSRPLVALGGTIPAVYGFGNLRPRVTSSITPDCSIEIQLVAGIDVDSLRAEYATDGGVNWTSCPPSCSAKKGSTELEQVMVKGVPFNQFSDQNRLRFFVKDLRGELWQSGPLKVTIIQGPQWKKCRSEKTEDGRLNGYVLMDGRDAILDVSSAQYVYSIDSGRTWSKPTDKWAYQYECDVLPAEAGWVKSEGRTGYESIQDGYLRIHDTGTQWGDKIKYTRQIKVDSSVGFTVVARMRCLAGGHAMAGNLGVADDRACESLYLLHEPGHTGVGLERSGKFVPLDVEQWHTYRLAVRGENIDLYVDENGQPVIAGTGLFTESGNFRNAVMIGSGASQHTQDVWYDFVYLRTDGAWAPGDWFRAEWVSKPWGNELLAEKFASAEVPAAEIRLQFRIFDVYGNGFQSPVFRPGTQPK